MKFKTKDLAVIAMSVSLIAVGAMIRIPSPVTSYFTLQLPFVIMVAVILGSKKAGIAALVYALGGLLGIPWFAAGGGITYLFKPTFGFIMSFVLAGLIAGYSKKVKHEWQKYGLTLLATGVVWLYGMLHYTLVLKLTSGTDLTYLAAVVGILSPDFYMDLILTLVFTKIGKRIEKGVALS
jgi:biotin transport system substrate-specific component